VHSVRPAQVKFGAQTQYGPRTPCVRVWLCTRTVRVRPADQLHSVRVFYTRTHVHRVLVPRSFRPSPPTASARPVLSVVMHGFFWGTVHKRRGGSALGETCNEAYPGRVSAGGAWYAQLCVCVCARARLPLLTYVYFLCATATARARHRLTPRLCVHASVYERTPFFVCLLCAPTCLQELPTFDTHKYCQNLCLH
jgi:hypothetical protein